MSPAKVVSQVEALPVQWIWRLAVAGTCGVAVYGLLLAGETFNRYFAGWLGARSVAGVLLMSIGFLGPFVPFLVALSRQRFVKLSTSRQWSLTFGLPLVQLLLLGAAGLALEKIRHPTPILPVPANAYTLTIHIQPDKSVHITANPIRQQESTGVHQSGDDTIDFEYFSGSERIIHLSGISQAQPPDTMEISAQLEFRAGTVRVQVQGLEDVTMTVGGREQTEPVDLPAGSHQLLIRGRNIK